MKRPSVKELVKKIEEARGNVSAIARAYGRPRTTVYGWINAAETTKQALEDQREYMTDVAESILLKKVLQEDLQAVMYTLNNSPQAKRRGWGPKQEISGPGGSDIGISLKDWRKQQSDTESQIADTMSAFGGLDD